MKLTVTVKANQRRDQIFWDGTQLLARIRAVPQKGKANDYLVRFMAGSLRVPPSLIQIVRGQASTIKTIEVDVPESDLVTRLHQLPGAPAQDQLF